MDVDTAVNDGLKVAAEVAPFAGPQVAAGVQIAETAAPLIEELVTFLIGLFHKHAPAATAEQVQAAATTHAQLAVSQLSGLTGAVAADGATVAGIAANAIENPPPPPKLTGGVTFHGSQGVPQK